MINSISVRFYTIVNYIDESIIYSHQLSSFYTNIKLLYKYQINAESYSND